MAKMATLKI